MYIRQMEMTLLEMGLGGGGVRLDHIFSIPVAAGL